MYIRLGFLKNKKLFVKQRRAYESSQRKRCGTRSGGKKSENRVVAAALHSAPENCYGFNNYIVLGVRF